MSPISPETGEILTKLAAKALGGPAVLFRVIAIATLSVAEILARFVDSALVADIYRVKESLLRRTEAESDAACADARKKLAEATEAANRTTLHARNEAIARAEEAELQARAAKTRAEAKAIRMDAETRRAEAKSLSQ